MSTIYLDANATTPLDAAVLAEMAPALTGLFANPSSVHKPGQEARALVDAARERCARALGCAPKEITFTSGGTEADALAILGPRPRKVVTTAVEHPAVLGACAAAPECVRVPVLPSGELDLEALRRALPGASICSVMAVNNETGVVFPLREVAALCREASVPLHVDAVQAAGKVPLDFPWDLLSVSAHKIQGPKGVGLLAVRGGLKVAALQAGGHQERGRRGGTENVAGIVGLGAALERTAAAQATLEPRLRGLRDWLEATAREIPGARVAGVGVSRVCNTLNVAFPGCDGETLLAALDLLGIAVSTGSACSSGSVEPSPVLLAMGYPPGLARGALRFSLWSGNTEEEIARVCAVLPGVVARARA
ncbi:MAG TPA: cysteine desulfurase family protein [Myxococcales bacterium]|nr:cysteine desulfurase family protein [Myxococcales bacterium]